MSTQINGYEVAGWKRRLVAWIIDVIIITIIVGAIFTGIDPQGLTSDEITSLANGEINRYEQSLVTGIILLAYLSVSEYRFATTIGKRVMGLKSVTEDGSNLSIVQSVASNFGKVFLWIIDVPVGLLFLRDTKQRVFQKVGNAYTVDAKI